MFISSHRAVLKPAGAACIVTRGGGGGSVSSGGGGACRRNRRNTVGDLVSTSPMSSVSVLLRRLSIHRLHGFYESRNIRSRLVPFRRKHDLRSPNLTLLARGVAAQVLCCGSTCHKHSFSDSRLWHVATSQSLVSVESLARPPQCGLCYSNCSSTCSSTGGGAGGGY